MATAQYSLRVDLAHAASAANARHGVLVVLLAAGEEALLEGGPVVGVLRRRGVRLLESLVALVGRGAGGEVRAVRRLHHAGHHRAVEQHRLDRGVDGHAGGVDDLLGRDVGLRRGHAEQVVEVRVGSEVLRVAPLVGAVHVHQRDVQRQRGYGDQLLRVVVRRDDGPQRRVVVQHRRAEPGSHRQERHPLGRGSQPGLEHPLVPLAEGRRGVLTGAGEQRLERDRVEGGERIGHVAGLARLEQQSDVGAGVGDDAEVGQVAAQDRPHQGHRLAPRAPAADADGHPGPDPGDDLLGGHQLARHAHFLAALSVPAKASRCSSETPERLSSIVNPCSKR